MTHPSNVRIQNQYQLFSFLIMNWNSVKTQRQVYSKRNETGLQNILSSFLKESVWLVLHFLWTPIPPTSTIFANNHPPPQINITCWIEAYNCLILNENKTRKVKCLHGQKDCHKYSIINVKFLLNIKISWVQPIIRKNRKKKEEEGQSTKQVNRSISFFQRWQPNL